MELLANLELGLATALTLSNVWYCLVGALLGTMIGVLPGVGPLTTIALLLPITFSLEPAPSLIMLAGIYYGAQYGGSTTAILLNLPGESSAAVTAIDGYQMARRGRAGVALATAAIGSFFAGCFATLVIAVFVGPLTNVALSFGSAEYFSLMVLGLTTSIALAHGSVAKAIAMVLLGVLLGLIGIDIYTGTPRLTMGHIELFDGLELVAVAVGLFGITEVLRNLEDPENREVLKERVTGLMPGYDDFRRMAAPIARGTLVGSILGVLPGGGALLSSFAAYTIEKKLASNPEEFGKGAIAGVAGPESANNAGAQTSFIPMLTLGIPSNGIMALMIGAMMIQGITPGPNVVNSQPDLFWGLIASMWIGNAILLALNLPLVRIWVSLLKVPYWVLVPAITVFSSVGVFMIGNDHFVVMTISLFGLLGYVLFKLGFEPAPLILGFVLGPLLEEHLRRAMIISDGNPIVFVQSPISLMLLAISVLALVLSALPSLSRKRQQIFVE